MWSDNDVVDPQTWSQLPLELEKVGSLFRFQELLEVQWLQGPPAANLASTGKRSKSLGPRVEMEAFPSLKAICRRSSWESPQWRTSGRSQTLLERGGTDQQPGALLHRTWPFQRPRRRFSP